MRRTRIFISVSSLKLRFKVCVKSKNLSSSLYDTRIRFFLPESNVIDSKCVCSVWLSHVTVTYVGHPGAGNLPLFFSQDIEIYIKSYVTGISTFKSYVNMYFNI